MKNKVIIIVLLSLGLYTCGTLNEKNKGKGFNIFPVAQDKNLGGQVAAEIESNPKDYPILDSAKNKEVYQYVYKIRDSILNSGKVDFKSDFPWRIRIIHDDKTLNAFCTPGGYIYVYTGILKFLESEDQLAGVLGHEIGHADMRHSTRQMTSQFGVAVLLEIIAGNKTLLKDVTSAIVGLKFSRVHETEADKRSVTYLCPTQYSADAGAEFFEKIQKLGGDRPPAFLSTHPNPEDRVENYRNLKVTLGCNGSNKYKTEYAAMLAKLPK